jgi:hypothetical protein
MYMVLEVL